MKQIVVISGKGGTGKTTVASSFAYLTENAHIADCDVEAPNMNLILNSDLISERPYIGGKIASIDKEKCINCGKCVEACRFDAIGNDFSVNEMKCEGCGGCQIVCKHDAVTMEDDETGQILKSKTSKGVFSHARLNIGADGAGKLVTEIRKEIMKDTQGDLTIIDGSPGIGCVVIASVTGCDGAVIVTEPTQSGMEDLIRVLNLTYHFNIESFVVINKYDINPGKTKEIEEFCEENGVAVVGRIPFDSYVNQAINEGKPVVIYPDSTAGQEIRVIWDSLLKKIGGIYNENCISS